MKKLVAVFCLLTTTSIFAQLSGEIVADQRRIISNISYAMDMNHEGILVFDIVVNTEGKVTSVEWNKIESTINSQRYAHEAKNRILTGLKFAPGNGYPTFHRGKVTITPMATE